VIDDVWQVKQFDVSFKPIEVLGTLPTKMIDTARCLLNKGNTGRFLAVQKAQGVYCQTTLAIKTQ
jgi:hypothetical protein